MKPFPWNPGFTLTIPWKTTATPLGAISKHAKEHLIFKRCYSYTLLIPMLICRCSDAFRELNMKGNYYQLRYHNSEGKDIHIIYPKHLHEIVSERVKGGQLALTG